MYNWVKEVSGGGRCILLRQPVWCSGSWGVCPLFTAINLPKTRSSPGKIPLNLDRGLKAKGSVCIGSCRAGHCQGDSTLNLSSLNNLPIQTQAIVLLVHVLLNWPDPIHSLVLSRAVRVLGRSGTWRELWGVELHTLARVIAGIPRTALRIAHHSFPITWTRAACHFTGSVLLSELSEHWEPLCQGALLVFKMHFALLILRRAWDNPPHFYFPFVVAFNWAIEK